MTSHLNFFGSTDVRRFEPASAIDPANLDIAASPRSIHGVKREKAITGARLRDSRLFENASPGVSAQLGSRYRLIDTSARRFRETPGKGESFRFRHRIDRPHARRFVARRRQHFLRSGHRLVHSRPRHRRRRIRRGPAASPRADLFQPCDQKVRAELEIRRGVPRRSESKSPESISTP